tara:strand:+ start:567 stop:938 length:372 start_codon:yes stop_codon:yes gene_type:complete
LRFALKKTPFKIKKSEPIKIGKSRGKKTSLFALKKLVLFIRASTILVMREKTPSLTAKEKGKNMEYIDLTPTWEEIAPAMMISLVNGKDHAEGGDLWNEFIKMAKLADKYKELLEELKKKGKN